MNTIKHTKNDVMCYKYPFILILCILEPFEDHKKLIK